MNGRIILVLGGSLLLTSACGTANAVSPTATTVTRSASAAATMTPAEMAAMAHPASAPTAEPAVQAAAAPTTTTARPAATNAASSAPTSAPTSPPATASTPSTTATPAASAPPAAPGSTVAVTLADMAIKLSAASVPGGTVTFAVTNSGTTTHELVVLQTTTAQSALAPDPANPGTVLEPGFLGKVANLAPRATGSLTLTLGPGSYVLICNEPAHYSALGMHTAFSVR